LVLLSIAIVRELVGKGTLAGFQILPESYQTNAFDGTSTSWLFYDWYLNRGY